MHKCESRERQCHQGELLVAISPVAPSFRCCSLKDNGKPSKDQDDVKFKFDIKDDQVERNIDYPGGFIAKFDDVTSLSKCKERCVEDSNCVRIMIFPDKMRCILKSEDHDKPSVETWAAKKGACSLAMDAKQKPKTKSREETEIEAFDIDIEGCCVKENVDFPGGFIARFDNVASLSECVKLCKDSKEDCVRIVANPKSGRCLLKNNMHEEANKDTWAAKQGCLSISMDCKIKKAPKSVKSDESPASGFKINVAEACVESDIDYPSGFIAAFNDIPSLYRCKQLCSENPKCVRVVAFPKSSRCVLKNKNHEEASKVTWGAKQGAVSVAMDCSGKSESKAKPTSSDPAKFKKDIRGPCVEKDVDYPGGFISKFEGVKSLSECKELCSEEENCVRLIAVPSKNLCLLKSKSHKAKNSETWVAENGGVSIAMKCNQKSKQPSPTIPPFTVDLQGSCVESGIDYPGGFLDNVEGVSSLSECRNLCSKNKDCVRFIALLAKNKCVLKSALHEEASSDTWLARSASRTASLKCLLDKGGEPTEGDGSFDLDIISDPCIKKNKDFNGGFLQNIAPITSLSACRNLCIETDGCVAFVVVPNKKTCKLKTSLAKYNKVPAENGEVAGRLNCEDIFGTFLAKSQLKIADNYTSKEDYKIK